jgi:alpha-L-arabinofuranosidase
MERAIISITTQHSIGPVDRKIYSGFVEHMGRCVYGGLVPATYPEKSDLDHCTEKNFRIDVIEAIKEVKPPLLSRRELYRQLQVDGRRWPDTESPSGTRMVEDRT